MKDLLGNIIRIIDTNGSLALSTINPYTYRGYRYDTELSYYYCNARYYQPLIGRWLNADHVGFLDPEGASGSNLFAYCGNNPVTHTFYNSPTVILSSSTIHFANIIASDSPGNSFWSSVWDWMNTIYGFLNPVSKLTFEYTIIVAIINGRWEDLEEDWDNGCFNPFNQDASTALKANVAGFYS